MALPASKALESYGVAADCIEDFFRRRGRVVSGSLVRVVDLLRQANENYLAARSLVEPVRPLSFKVVGPSAMPDERIMMLAEGQLIGAALHHFSTHEGCSVDDTLLTRELCSEVGEQRWLDGAKTVILGYRLHVVAGGEIRLFGNQEAGRDILWTPPSGCPVSVECKNRDWSALWKRPEKWREWVLDRLKKMRTGLQKHPPLRLAFVHIPAAPALGTSIQDAVGELIAGVQKDVEYVGGLSGVGISPSSYALSTNGQPVLHYQPTFVEFHNPDRRMPAQEVITRAALAAVFGAPPDPPVALAMGSSSL